MTQLNTLNQQYKPKIWMATPTCHRTIIAFSLLLVPNRVVIRTLPIHEDLMASIPNLFDDTPLHNKPIERLNV